MSRLRPLLKSLSCGRSLDDLRAAVVVEAYLRGLGPAVLHTAYRQACLLNNPSAVGRHMKAPSDCG